MTPTAMETNNNIDRLLAMLDHPERYSEQEIMDTVNRERPGSNLSKRIWQRKSMDACGKEWQRQ